MTPELWQIMFNPNSISEYDVPDYLLALLFYIRQEAQIVYWNKYQQDIDLSIDEWITELFEFRPYDWSFDSEEDKYIAPNIKFQDIEIKFYKHLWRWTTVNKKKTEKQWVKWFNEFLSVLEKINNETFNRLEEIHNVEQEIEN